jgi:diaminohydroxyphosphoribosylaminopyrimidine deaminase/5-amino-6-(5-phosphoribosylamino)uracil reductase
MAVYHHRSNVMPPEAAFAEDDTGEGASWRTLLALREARRRSAPIPGILALAGTRIALAADGGWSEAAPLPEPVRQLLALYLPYCLVPGDRRFAVAHLAQSLDGRIATIEGASRWISGDADLVHAHRMRALADAVVVGAETVRRDDPLLTVRRCSGANPVRVVLDPKLSLCDGCTLFADGASASLVIAAADAPRRDPDGVAVLRLPAEDGEIAPATIRDALAERGLRFLFIEGGGRTVSRFLAAGQLDRLQLAVAPVIIGSGRPGIVLPAIASIEAGLRPATRRFELGADTLFECIFGD